MLKPKINHAWNLTETEAVALQRELAKKVVMVDELPDEVKIVAGIDVAYDKTSDRLIAAVVLLDAETQEVIERVVVSDEVQFEYIPGLFSFREMPPVVKALEQISQVPDLIVCDCQGVAHPRRFGFACHLGILFDIPTIGCGKTRLTGEFGEVEMERGCFAPLVSEDEVIGSVLRTQTNVKPIYVSVGHKVSLETAREWVLRLASKYRLPETTRQADHEANMALKHGAELGHYVSD